MTLRAGKLPATVLGDLLAAIPHRDPRVLVGPAVGRDAAVIEFGDRMLVAKMDPITFATEHIGWYAVNVNANDIACMGARPAWFMATVLLPPGAPSSLPGEILAQLTAACDGLGIELVGGHSEVTLGLDRPIIAGAMLGEASRDEIIPGAGIVAGDRVLLAGSIAIEGTALLARDAAAELRGLGIADAMLARAAALLFDPGISVVRAAEVIQAACRPRLLHDPTEGGIATALHELASAADCTLAIDLTAIDVLPETQEICDALSLEPLGLIASGALLAIVSADDEERVRASLGSAKIRCAAIGTVVSGSARVILGSEDETPLSTFERDELARFYGDMKGTD